MDLAEKYKPLDSQRFDTHCGYLITADGVPTARGRGRDKAYSAYQSAVCASRPKNREHNGLTKTLHLKAKDTKRYMHLTQYGQSLDKKSAFDIIKRDVYPNIRIASSDVTELATGQSGRCRLHDWS